MAPNTKKATETEAGFNLDLAKALGHPLRFRSLHILNCRVASPSEIARELNVPVNNLNYHIEKLVEYGCIELVKTQKKRGTTESFYRATSRARLTDNDWIHLPATVQDDISFDVMAVIGREVSAAFRCGSFNSRPDRRQSYLELDLDEEGWKKATGVLATAEETLLEIEAESVNRRAASNDGDEPTVAMGVTLLGFEICPGK